MECILRDVSWGATDLLRVLDSQINLLVLHATNHISERKYAEFAASSLLIEIK